MAGLLPILNAAQTQDKQAVEEGVRQALIDGPAQAETDQFIGQLDTHIDKCWQAAKSAKESHIEPDMLEDMRQREGKYSPAKLAEIVKQGGSEIYMMLTNVKCRAAEGWIRDILMPSGERPFTADAGPAPEDLPDDMKQEVFSNTMGELQQAIASGLYVTPQQVFERSQAMYDICKQRIKDEADLVAHRMEDAIDEKLIDGLWYEALADMISDLIALPSAFLKGPVIRKETRLTWGKDAKGRNVPIAADELVPMFYSPSSFDMYPSGDSRGIDDGYLFERMTIRRAPIFAMIGVPGYKEESIRASLDEYDTVGYDIMGAGDQQRRNLENSQNYKMTPDAAIDALEFHGSVRGEWLLEWGVPIAQVTDKDMDYEVTALKIGRHVVRCVLNEDPLKRRPYDKSSFDSIKGQFWGRGLPRIIADIQGMCNAAARACVNNMGIASGPIIEVEVDRLAEGEDATQLYPWRIFQTKSSKNSTPSPAIHVTQIPSVVDQLIKVYQYFSKLADDYSGIPSYEQGINPTAGAAGTASGLSMLMTASSRQIKRVFMGIDTMIDGSVSRMHTHLMLYGDDPNIKGDCDLRSRGTASLVAKEQQQMRRMQLMQTTANPIDATIFGVKGRTELWKETLKSMEINPDKVLPTDDEIARQANAPQPGAPGAPPPGPPAAPNPLGQNNPGIPPPVPGPNQGPNGEPVVVAGPQGGTGQLPPPSPMPQ